MSGSAPPRKKGHKAKPTGTRTAADINKDILARVKEVLMPAYLRIANSKVTTALAMVDGREKFQITVDGANFFSEDALLIGLERERQSLTNGG